MQFILVDDIPEHNQILQYYIQSACVSLSLTEISFFTFQDAKDAYEFACQNKELSVYFLDIDLGSQTTGLTLRQKIQEADPTAYIVYVSAHEEFALLCCQSHAFDFLRKPVIPNDVKACIEAIVKDSRLRTVSKNLPLHLGSQVVFISPDDILYAERQNAFCVLHTEKNIYTIRISLSNLMEELNLSSLIRIHRSIFVNLKQVGLIDLENNFLKLKNGDTLHISRRYSKEISKHYNDFSCTTF